MKASEPSATCVVPSRHGFFSRCTTCPESVSDRLPLAIGGRIDPLARYRLEQLLSDCARPPIANGSLSLTDSGQVVHRLKKPWRHGTTHVALGPLAFIQRL